MDKIDGKKFECTECGACCRWDGVVNLTNEDIERLSDHFEMRREEFLDKYTIPQGGKSFVLKNKDDIKDCVFMKGDRCGIFDVKPKQCDDYPLKYDKRCPGFKTDRSANMANAYEDAVKMVFEKMSSGDEYSKKITEGLFSSLLNDKKTASVTEGAIEEGIDAFFSNNTVKIASLDDLFSFDRASKKHLIHKSTQDLWSIDKGADGEVQITRMFDASGEPIKG